jgi:hypothetical protein
MLGLYEQAAWTVGGPESHCHEAAESSNLRPREEVKMEMLAARPGLLGILASSMVALLTLPAGTLADDGGPLSLHAFAMNFTGVGSGGSGEIDIIIERWSTDEERDRLRDVLAEKGGAGLLLALQQIKPGVGYIHPKRAASWEVQYARSSTLADGGRSIVLATDRPLTPAERSKQRRSDEYDFLLVEIRLDKDGKGEGKTADGTKVSLNKSTGSLEIDKYSAQPVKLIHVEVVAPKPKP